MELEEHERKIKELSAIVQTYKAKVIDLEAAVHDQTMLHEQVSLSIYRYLSTHLYIRMPALHTHTHARTHAHQHARTHSHLDVWIYLGRYRYRYRHARHARV